MIFESYHKRICIINSMLVSLSKLLNVSNSSTVLAKATTGPAAFEYSQADKAKLSFAVKTLHMLAPRYMLDGLPAAGTQSYAGNHRFHLVAVFVKQKYLFSLL